MYSCMTMDQNFWRQAPKMKDVAKNDYLTIIDNILEEYPDLCQELSNKANKLSNDAK